MASEVRFRVCIAIYSLGKKPFRKVTIQNIRVLFSTTFGVFNLETYAIIYITITIVLSAVLFLGFINQITK
jgi:hypothetical protein